MAEESMVGIIPNVRSGFLGQKAYNLVFTTERMAVAQLTSQMIKNEAQQRDMESKERGEGRLSRYVSTMTAGTSLYKRYETMPVSEILAENPGNYAIEANQVKSFHIKKGGVIYDGTDHLRNRPHELHIKWAGGKTIFKFSSMDDKEAKTLMQKVFRTVR